MEMNIDIDNFDEETLRKLKDVLIQTYGTAMQVNPIAQAELTRIQMEEFEERDIDLYNQNKGPHR